MVSNGTGPYLKSCTSLLQKDSQCSQPQPLSSQATHPTSQGLSPPHQDPAGALPSCSLWPQTRSSQWAQIPFSALLKHPVASECPRAWEPHSLSLITGLGTPNQTTPKFCLYKQPCPVVEQTWDPQSYGASFLWGHQLLGMVLQPQRVAQQILPEPGLQEHQLTFLC